jgi:signal transduction histidine kinase
MSRIQTLRTCGRNAWLENNGSVNTPEAHHPFGRGAEELRTTNGSALEWERSAIAQMLVPFISHDIRHYLASINCNVDFMSDPAICQTDREQLLAEVRGTIHDMIDLLDSFLLSVRTERTVHLQSKSLNLLIKRVVGMVGSHPDARDCELVVYEAPSIEARIDSQRLGTAVYNLLLNACQALKHCSPPKRVEIALGHDDRYHCIRLEDNGPGVPDCIRNMLFHPFSRIAEMSGIGLGLKIAQQAVRAHGGCLTLEESHPGKTVFVLQIPDRSSVCALTEECSE